MNHDQDRAETATEYQAELTFAQDLDRVCGAHTHAAVQRLRELKEQLVTLFLRLQEEGPAPKARAEAVNAQAEISRLIWSLEDWQLQFDGRN